MNLKNVIIQQKDERDSLLQEKYVNRELLTLASKSLDNNLIKVIIGPRRAGKSVFAILLLKGKNFAYINFDDESLPKQKDYNEFMKTLFEVYGKFDYVLFDEIHNLPQWELFVEKLRRRKFNIILTGSNANLLSKDLASTLTGRHLTFEILPFSFKEVLAARSFGDITQERLALPEEKGIMLNILSSYMQNGGFPEIVVKKMETKPYLSNLFDSVLLKDIVKRYGIRHPHRLYDLALYLTSIFASQYSFTKSSHSLSFGSVHTIKDYVGYLEEAYLVTSIPRFSYKTKELLKAPRKIYAIDNGFIKAKAQLHSQNIGRLMEQLVFTNLWRSGYRPGEHLFYYKTKNQKEVDFVIKEEMKITALMQVSLEAESSELPVREATALAEAAKELRCKSMFVITWDKPGFHETKAGKVVLVPLWKFLTSDINQLAQNES